MVLKLSYWLLSKKTSEKSGVFLRYKFSFLLTIFESKNQYKNESLLLINASFKLFKRKEYF
ncbi:hypothetical protein OA88_18945 [Flavobacterium sp. JRM]|nr:hypothetical protein OA88_18945 [Flavobacterium sp. JRM]